MPYNKQAASFKRHQTSVARWSLPKDTVAKIDERRRPQNRNRKAVGRYVGLVFAGEG